MRHFIYKSIAATSNLFFKNASKGHRTKQKLWKPETSNYEYIINSKTHENNNSKKFVQSFFTEEGEKFIKSNQPHTAMQQMIKDFLTGVCGMRHVDAASLLQINKMFVFDHLTLLNLLQPSNSKNTCAFDTVLDIGAGDGYVTETAYKKTFKNIEVTEASAGCIESLSNNPSIHHVHFETNLTKFINEKKKFNLISMLNVLDRCDKPISLLRDAHRCLDEKEGRLIVALTYPHRPFVVENKLLKPEQAEKFDKLDLQSTFSDFIDKSIEHFNLNKFEVDTFTRVPYICVGSSSSDNPYSCLSCALFVCSIKS
jgi:2-polyprenyl-3-methyl-5-hydroxy-6-metoxy-1,4-benzoquinol methylase